MSNQLNPDANVKLEISIKNISYSRKVSLALHSKWNYDARSG